MFLRDRFVAAIDTTLDALGIWIGVAMTAFIGYALSRHVDIRDALAITFAWLLLLRAVRKRGDA